MQDSMFILGGDLNCRMHSRGGRATDQERLRHVTTLHFMRYVYHFIKRRSDQAAQTNDISIFLFSRIENLVSGYHYTKVNNVISVATQYHTDYIFSNIMYIAFNGSQ